MLTARERRLYRTTKKNAQVRGIEFALTPDELYTLVVRAKGCCELTGLFFNDDKADGVRRRPYGMSIDRIDCQRGYSIDNLRLICIAMNIALNQWGEDVFIKIAHGYLGMDFPTLDARQAQGYKCLEGVRMRRSPRSRKLRYVAQIRVRGVYKIFGTYDTQEEAHAASMRGKLTPDGHRGGIGNCEVIDLKDTVWRRERDSNT